MEELMARYYDKRWSAPVSDNRHQLHVRVPATPAGVVKARHLVTGWSERHGADADLQGDIALAVTEATTNAVLHG
jgi:anti-sigma regulatory factor (Ser/Thr protein kinase)